MKKHICFVGASTVEGLGDETCQGWVGRLARSYQNTPQEFVAFNLGIRGNTQGMMKQRAAAECKARFMNQEHGRIIVSASVNDVAYLNGVGPRTPKRSMERSFADLLSQLKALAQVVVTGPPPVLEQRLPMDFYGYDFSFKNADIYDAELAIQTITQDMSVPFLPCFSALQESQTYQKALSDGDGVHPTGAGYQVMAEQVKAWPEWQALIN